MKFRFIQLMVMSLLLSLTAMDVYSQDSKGSILVFLSSHPRSDSDSTNLEEIINDSISLELKVKGFRVLTENDEDRAILFNKALELGSPYIIESTYSTANSILDLQMSIIRVSDKTSFYSSSVQSILDLDLDKSLRSPILKIIENLNIDIERNPPEIVKEELPEQNDNLTESESEIKPEIEAEKVPDIETTDTKQEKDVSEVVTQDEQFKKLKISTGFSPFLTTGEASGYFTLGLTPEIHFEYRFQTSFGYFGLGIQSSVNYFIATGLLVSSENLLIALGPEIRLGIDATPFLGLFLRLSSGVSLFLLNKNEEGFMSTLIPYISGGLGMEMNLTRAFGLYISGNYTIYFEESVFITGFSPTLGLHLKL